MKLLVALLTLVALIWTGCYFVNKAADAFSKELSKPKENIGKHIVVNKDTLLILDYSNLTEVYKLNNGTEVSYEYLNQNKAF